jgi:serine/threonine protein kinase
MGVVYLVRNRRMDRLEALKVVRPALLEREGALERFEREMRSAARLNHTNIVAAYSAPPLEGLVAFAMEYVEGTDLQQFVQSKGPLPVAKACFYVYQAALGLQHAADRQMVHRDIKPANLMLARDGKRQVVKILDFGLAKATLEHPIDQGLTSDGQVLGTPQFMAPEQIRNAAAADIRADIYSLGCTLYYLLTGSPPFHDKRSVYDIFQAHQNERPRPLDEARADVPGELAAIVARMTAKDPAHRYQQPAEVAQAVGPHFRQPAKTVPEVMGGNDTESSKGTGRWASGIPRLSRLGPHGSPVAVFCWPPVPASRFWWDWDCGQAGSSAADRPATSRPTRMTVAGQSRLQPFCLEILSRCSMVKTSPAGK